MPPFLLLPRYRLNKRGASLVIYHFRIFIYKNQKSSEIFIHIYTVVGSIILIACQIYSLFFLLIACELVRIKR